MLQGPTKNEGKGGHSDFYIVVPEGEITSFFKKGFLETKDLDKEEIGQSSSR